ncbi:hypothetical protein SCP_1500780 [Sparassis crispa]|uniref:Transcription activator GCR1-like domain-containing protein n=1 Tax=Sparassis crispa TaxID=139825 RepID=A0A401H3Q9_9APHY|nr:hypothetical protein SCP_1500780 [Sparassis crispa]GBE89075.1 hypothetical protein SCP_1500780 [Sparassis crispa]
MGLELAQQRDHELNDVRWNALSHDVSQLKTLLEEAVSAPVRCNCKHRSGGSGSVSSGSSTPTPMPDMCNMPRTASDRHSLAVLPPMLPPPVAPSLPLPQTLLQTPSSLSPMMPVVHTVEQQAHLTTPGLSSPSISTSPSVITINIMASPSAAPSVASSLHDSPVGSSSSSHHEFRISSGACAPSPVMAAAMHQPVGLPMPHLAVAVHSGTVPMTSTPLSSLVPQNSSLTPQALKWAVLAHKHGDEQLQQHAQWDFHGEWLPYYEYQSVRRITDIWMEWAEGIRNYLPVWLLCEEWGANWHRNVPKLKTEANRRIKVIQLVEALQKK